MYFPQFLIGMVVASGASAAWAYSATGSLMSVAIWAILALILLQTGYFVLLLGLVYGSRGADRAAGSTQTAGRSAVDTFS
ncbi:hypothetical protein EN873_22745 [bacterium M00.F.Ca.ET.230.01.1.1]|nr:hypothetical protein EN873_22745 [bacterium M00.F.Ca.ET.230.01.1.1]